MTTEQRLSRLEKQNWRLRFGFVLLVCVGIGGVLMGQTRQGRVPEKYNRNLCLAA